MSSTNENHAWNNGFYGVPKEKPEEMTQAQHTAHEVGKQQRDWFKMMEKDILGEKQQKE